MKKRVVAKNESITNSFQPSVVELINLWQTLYNVIAIAISVADMLLFLLYQFLYV